jgi:L-alanine-DL-glutamate epimerase-like enolase superfamily enzyme
MDGDGMVTVPQRPGIGVTVDTDLVDDLTVRSASFSTRR